MRVGERPTFARHECGIGGTDRARAEKLPVMRLGPVKDLSHVLRALNRFMLSSRVETLPNVQLEAQSDGASVVAFAHALAGGPA